MQELTISTRLDEAFHALTIASDNFERIRIRDQAAAVKVAALVLQRRDIEVRASILMADAERALAMNNPPLPPGRPRSDAPVEDVLEDEDKQRKVSRLIKEARVAHVELPEDRYDEIKRVAIRDMEPISRRQLVGEVRAYKKMSEPPAPKPETPKEPAWRPDLDPDSKEYLKLKIRSLNERIEALEAENEDLKERISIALSDDIQERLDGILPEMRTLRSQLQNRIHEVGRLNAQIFALKKKLEGK